MPSTKKPSAKHENLFLLTGENTYELLRFLRNWYQSATEKYGEYNVVRYDYNEKPVNEILAELHSPPFFGDGKRIFFLDQFPPPPPSRPLSEAKKQQMSALADALCNVDKDTIVIMAVAKPDKRTAAYKKIVPIIGSIQEFSGWERGFDGQISAKGSQQALQWIKKESQGQVQESAARFLLEFCGDDPWSLASEIKKLVTYCQATGGSITKEVIEQLCLPSDQMMNFAFSNAMQQGRLEPVLAIFERLVSGGEAPQAIMARDLMPTIRQLLQVRVTIDTGRSPSESGLHPFVFKKLVGIAQKFSIENLTAAHESLLKIDIDSKTGVLPISPDHTELFRLRIESLLLDLFQKRSLVR